MANRRVGVMAGPVWETLETAGDNNPYVLWWRDIARVRLPEGAIDGVDHLLSENVRALLQSLPARSFDQRLLQRVTFGDILTASAIPPEPEDTQYPGAQPAKTHHLIQSNFGPLNPIPAGVRNPDYDAFIGTAGSSTVGHIDVHDGNEVADPANPAMLSHSDIPPDDAVVVGIIDAAIALGHQRFMRKDGRTTRFLAAWQQAAQHIGSQAFLPYGRELLKPEIDRLLDKATVAGTLDEDAFNAVAGLVDLHAVLGQRELNHTVAHGTHVLDLATGFDINRGDVDDDMLRKRPIIAVNLPSRETIGSAGSFLEMFVIPGIERIVEISDRIWSLGPGRQGNDAGYPIVINLSYSLQAGPKDGSMLLESFARNLIETRKSAEKAPLRIVLPAGNDNLDRGNGVWQLTDEPVGIDWRIQPEDQTSNYLEIWTGPLETATGLPLKISVTPPGCSAEPMTVGGSNSVLKIAEYARVYCQDRTAEVCQVDGQVDEVRRQRYVVCVAPTLSLGGHLPGTDHAATRIEAPSGLWRINLSLDPAIAESLDVFVNVQTDQSTRPGAATGRTSYLDSARYQKYTESGLQLDTYRRRSANLTVDDADQEKYREHGPVQRKGSINAIASLGAAVVVAGHRVSDGKPAPYSSTGMARGNGLPDGRPTLSYPSDDGPAHQGLLAAGSRSGIVVAMQGTSFATAQATREIADILHGSNAPASGKAKASTDDLHHKASAVEAAQDPMMGKVSPLKSGAGRMSGTPTQRMPRREPR